jgi:hypothetical protein
LRERSSEGYHQLWGNVHPLLLSPRALAKMGQQYGFAIDCYSSPYNFQQIATGSPGETTGNELLAIAEDSGSQI